MQNMQNLMTSMRLNKNRKQAIVLYISTLFGIWVGMLVSILNTRHLAPAEYGDVRHFNNIIQMLPGIFLFGYFVTGCRLLAYACILPLGFFVSMVVFYPCFINKTNNE